MRPRNLFLTLLIIIPTTLWMLADPDTRILENLPFGAGFISMLTMLSIALLGIALVYISRKGMHDYPIADFEKLGQSASRSPEGAGQYAIAIAIKTLAYAIVIAAAIIASAS